MKFECIIITISKTISTIILTIYIYIITILNNTILLGPVDQKVI